MVQQQPFTSRKRIQNNDREDDSGARKKNAEDARNVCQRPGRTKEQITERNNTLGRINSRITRRDEKPFPSGQGKEIEENNRMGKTSDLFKKITDTKEEFHAKIGSKRTEMVRT